MPEKQARSSVFMRRRPTRIGKLREVLPDYLENMKRVHFFFGREAAWDRTIMDAIKAVSGAAAQESHPPSELVNAAELLHAARRIKSPFEIARMQRAADVTVAAHRRALLPVALGRPSTTSRPVLEYEFRRGGAKREAYESIVASGDNATILHYRENDRRMLDGEPRAHRCRDGGRLLRR